VPRIFTAKRQTTQRGLRFKYCVYVWCMVLCNLLWSCAKYENTAVTKTEEIIIPCNIVKYLWCKLLGEHETIEST